MTQKEWVARLKKLAQESKDLTGELLVAIDELLQNSTFAYYHPSFIACGSGGRALMAELEEACARKALNDLKRQLRQKKYIELSKEGDRIIRLTETGQARCLETKIKMRKEELPDDWYCVVAFDIPEDIKETRQRLRRTLRQMGFECHQRSVWVTKKDVCSELMTYLQLIKAEKWVTVLRAETKNLRVK